MKTLAQFFLILTLANLNLMAQDIGSLRKERDKLKERGMWRDLVNFYEEKLLPISDEGSGSDLARATEALGRLNAWKEFDGLVERAVAAQPGNASLLTSAAEVYRRAPHSGSIIAGEFQRDGAGRYGRGGFNPADESGASAGQAVDTDYRDQIRSLQLLREATTRQASVAESILAWREMAQVFMQNESWKLQTLTPLDKLPEWGEPGPDGGTEGAPWKGDGPVLFAEPKSWEAATNNGERWRFALAEQARLSSEEDMKAVMISERAKFSHSQFGTESLASYGWWQQQDPASAKGILEMDTLTEDECLAKTSDGVRRFKLPAEYHFIALYRSILDNKLVGGTSGDTLTQIFLNRHQFDKAREVLEQTIAKHGPGNNDSRKKLLKQITGNWGRFEAAETVPAGVKPKLPLVYRNASRIKLTASPVDMDAVIQDTITYLKSNPRELDWERLNPSQIARRLITKEGKYIGKPAATWETPLTPGEKHRDTRTDIEVPLDIAGAWWISGEVEGGNSFHTLVWIVDSVLVQNDVAGKKQWWVADAASGAPVVDSEIEFFGYREIDLERKLPLQRRNEVRTKGFNPAQARRLGRKLPMAGHRPQEGPLTRLFRFSALRCAIGAI